MTPDRGDFPFPLTNGPQESRYLTWLRNHSNYMGVEGVLDYAGALMVLLRGIVINALVLLPFLLVLSLAVAAGHLYPARPPFEATAAVLVLVLLFPLAVPLWRIWQYRRRLWTGSDSSVQLRRRLELYYGRFLLLVAGVVLFEAVVYLLDDFNALNVGRAELAAVALFAVAFFVAGQLLMSRLGGIAAQVALLAVGAVGFVVPLLVVLFVADYLVFDAPSDTFFTLGEICFTIFSAIIVFALCLGVWRRSFTRTDLLKMLVLLAIPFVIFRGVQWLDEEGWDQAQALRGQLEPLDVQPPPDEELASLVDHLLADPGPALDGLFDQLDESRLVGPPAPESVPEQPPDPVVLELEAHSDFVPELHPLIEVVEQLAPDERARRAEELLAPTKLFERFPVVRNFGERERVELVLALLAAADEDFEDRRIDDPTLPDRPDAILAELAGRFDLARDGAFARSWDLVNTREELAHRAYFSRERYPDLYREAADAGALRTAYWRKAIDLAVFIIALVALVWITVDVNLTSIHGLYRDRLASAFLMGLDRDADPSEKAPNLVVERDIDLAELSCHEAGSVAPYHLVNVALNLQGSQRLEIRDRNSGFFIFSKRFIGGGATGYCRSENMELVFPQIDLATAMAISAAAASPNMGRMTSASLTAIMILLNIRMGYWIPNPGRLETWLWDHEGAGGKEGGYRFREVFAVELDDVERRWEALARKREDGYQRSLAPSHAPTPDHGLVGIGFSGGGIRSATLNLGIAQALNRRGVFEHIDYMSTVSGGGYLGSSISTLMREETKTTSDFAGEATVDEGENVVTITQPETGESRTHRFGPHAEIAIEKGARVRAGQRLLRRTAEATEGQDSLGAEFSWRVRPAALLWEVTGRLNEESRWVNVSDGGHLENLAGIELLRRRCRYVIIGDGEADPEHHFTGLATLIRYARIDLAIHIDIDVDRLRLSSTGHTRAHWALGRIRYPEEETEGYLLYLKSSISGDEDEVIRQYRSASPSFPHESTADQFFTEGQFEAYRSLGQHIAEQALAELPESQTGREQMSYADLETWFGALARDLSSKAAAV